MHSVKIILKAAPVMCSLVSLCSGSVFPVLVLHVFLIIIRGCLHDLVFQLKALNFLCILAVDLHDNVLGA